MTTAKTPVTMEHELTRALDAAFAVAAPHLWRAHDHTVDQAAAAAVENTSEQEAITPTTAPSPSPSSLTAATQQWVNAVHTAFYAPVPRGVAASGGNKFLELETALTNVLTKLCRAGRSNSTTATTTSSSCEHAPPDAVAPLLRFMVRALLLLCEASARAPATATATDHASARASESNASSPVFAAPPLAAAEAESEGKTPPPPKPRTKRGKQRASKGASQPHTPLAFIAVNALRNLTESDDRELQRHGTHWCAHEGATNVALIELCVRGLEDPTAMVRPSSGVCLLA